VEIVCVPANHGFDKQASNKLGEQVSDFSDQFDINQATLDHCRD
jgi:hypothetical protein